MSKHYASGRINWQRLDDGSWGVKVQAQGHQPAPGMTVDVPKRDGSWSHNITLGPVMQTWRYANTIATVFAVARDRKPAAPKAATGTPTYRAMPAKFDGKCYRCDEAVWEGDAIEYARDAKRGEKVRHADCAAIKRDRDAGRARVAAEADRAQDEYVAAAAMRAIEEEMLAFALTLASDADLAAQLEDLEKRDAFMRRNPPTMDYMVEWSREMAASGVRRFLTQAIVAEQNTRSDARRIQTIA